MKYLREIIQDLKRMPLIVAFSVGAVLRTQVILKSDFPINDGGMFFVMIKDLIANGFNLPLFTSYNSSQIPFTYPPFAFYFAAFIHEISGIEITQLLRFIPLINSIITIPFFYLLSRNLYSRKTAILATFVFAILPRSFEWQIMGGGLTRSFGFLFSIITIYFFTKKAKKINSLFCSIFLALTCLSHLEWLAFTVVTLILLILFKKISLINSFKTFLLAIIWTLPWLVNVVFRSGLEPFLSFFQAGVALKNTLVYTQVLFLQITDEYFLTIFGVLSVVGFFIQIARKDLFSLLWLIVPLVFAQRSAPNLTSIPISILSGIAISEISILIYKLAKNKALRTNKIFIIFLFSYSILSTVALVFFESDYYYYDSLTRNEQKEMSSIPDKVPLSECVLVLSNKTGGAWGVDNLAEWFPALAERKSSITAQGTEWLPGNVFYQKINFYHDIKTCFNQGLDCLEDVEKEYESYCKFIYIEKPEADSFSTALIEKELNTNRNYQLLFDGQTADLYGRE